MIGETLGKYELLDKIGEGAMGAVYLGRHELLDQKVAVKVLADRLTTHEVAKQRFIQEGQFIARLRHNNIVTVYDLGVQDGVIYLAMEYVEGKPLSWLIETRGTLKPLRALDIARQVADALTAAHDENVVHRDIKPDNIMVNQNGKVKVMDFGIAKEMDTRDATVTSEGVSIGTLLYMSPEQCRGINVDQRSDLYALGVVLYEVLVGRHPYSKDLPNFDLMDKIVNEPFPSIREANEEITEVVDGLVRKLTASEPEDRYQTASDLSDDIRHVIRIKAYRADANVADANLAKNAFNFLFGGANTKDGAKIERSAVARRKADRRLAEKAAALEQALERIEGGKREQRYAVRKKCKALLHENCITVIDIDMGEPPRTVKLLDLSEGGASVFIDDKLSKPSRHVIELRMDDGTVVRSPAEVTWIRFMEKRDGYATGFKFVDTPDEETTNLLRALAGIRKLAQA